MPPRPSNERLDFTPILTHYLFLFTTVFAVVSTLLSALWYDISLMLTSFFFFRVKNTSLRGSSPLLHK
jgi:uncharacterized membrane protein YagU involved in acid resistance